MNQPLSANNQLIINKNGKQEKTISFSWTPMISYNVPRIVSDFPMIFLGFPMIFPMQPGGTRRIFTIRWGCRPGASFCLKHHDVKRNAIAMDAD